MSDHDEWVARGFCPEIYEGRWCRLWADHADVHVAPWEYDWWVTMVRWETGGLNVKYVAWVEYVPVLT